MSYFPVGVLLVLCLVAALSHALPHSSPRHLADEQQLSDNVGEVRMQSADVVAELKVKDNVGRDKRSRAKRSVGWWLAASIHMCDKHPHTCRQVSVQQADLRITIELRDE